jgi:uncharacterized protein YjiS (DUF1127 family)
MASIDTTRHMDVATPFKRVALGFSDLVAAVAEWNEARLTRAALARLSDRELDGIGLSRADIEAIGTGRR